MVSPMTDVTQSAEPVIDIWPYIHELTKEKIVPEYAYNNHLVEKVYRNGLKTFEHVLLPTGNINSYVVIIVDLHAVSIKGYYVLDLEKEYQVSN